MKQQIILKWRFFIMTKSINSNISLAYEYSIIWTTGCVAVLEVAFVTFDPFMESRSNRF